MEGQPSCTSKNYCQAETDVCIYCLPCRLPRTVQHQQKLAKENKGREDYAVRHQFNGKPSQAAQQKLAKCFVPIDQTLVLM